MLPASTRDDFAALADLTLMSNKSITVKSRHKGSSQLSPDRLLFFSTLYTLPVCERRLEYTMTARSASLPTIDPTPRQTEILEFIRQTLTESGAPPTRDEIAQAFGFRSLNAAEQHLQALRKKGLIELVAGTSRGIRLKDSVRELMLAAQESGLPLIGRVAAGSPILAQENVMFTAAIDPATFKPYADYLLEVRGMSMRDAGIFEGDWLAVHKQPDARSGQVVVARLGDEVTVKRLKLRGSRAELIAANPDFEPILVDLKREPFAIEGIAVGVIRASL